MGLSSFLARLRRPRPTTPPQVAPHSPPRSGEQPVPAPPLRATMPTPGQLRRERRALVRAREERIRDLGGIMLEMYKRDHFRQDLVADQCGELVSLEGRLQEVDSLLAGLSSRGPVARCACGAPLVWGSHFCANCGRPVGETPVLACPRCEHPLPADARFCARCGTFVEQGDDTQAPPAETPPETSADQHATPQEAKAVPQPEGPAEVEPAPDRWERE